MNIADMKPLRCEREGCHNPRGCSTGFCSVACRDLSAVERERDAARAEVERQKKLARELRRWWRTTAELNADFMRERDEAMSCLDEARAEAARLRENLEWSEACRKARLSMAETCLNGRAEGKSPCGACSICCGDLKAEIAHLRRGIAAYQEKLEKFCATYRITAGKCGCPVCTWEREDEQREKV